ncbi:MAG: oligosaccharide flippase family protein [Actinomycetota bacterium]|nr:oligosaccharide flippase family protein [Actinomycetota bacterium]
MGAPDPDGRSTAPSARVEARWSTLTFAVNKVITLAATVALARLLAPADFGLVMLAFVAINVLGLFGDLGLGATLVVRQDLDRRGLGTALSLLLLTGLFLALLLVAGAPLLSAAFDQPRLTGVVRALAPMALLGSFSWFYRWLLQRDVRFRDRFFGFFAQSVAYAVVGVGAAALGAGVWSIVLGHLAGQVAMAVVFLAIAGPLRPRFDVAIARSLLRTSRGFLLQNAASLLQEHADYVAVGRVLGAAPLGLYSMAYRLSELPYLAVADPVTKVTFSAFSRGRARGDDIRDRYLTSLRLVALVTCPIGILLSAVAVPLTDVVYGPKWLPATAALAALGLWGAVKCVQTAIAWFFNSMGGAGVTGVVAMVVLVLQVPFLFLAAEWAGIGGVGWVLLAGVTLSSVTLVACVHRRAAVSLGAHVRALWPVAVSGAATWVAARVVATWATSPPLLGLAASTAVGVGVYVGLISLLAPGSVPMVLGLLRRTPARGPAAPTAEPPRATDASRGPSAPDAGAPAERDRSGAPAGAPPPPTRRSS